MRAGTVGGRRRDAAPGIWCRGDQPQADPIKHTEVADWLITGGLRCSSFGMPADRAFISEQVALQALGRIELET
jgi:hypothetical protein